MESGVGSCYPGILCRYVCSEFSVWLTGWSGLVVYDKDFYSGITVWRNYGLSVQEKSEESTGEFLDYRVVSGTVVSDCSICQGGNEYRGYILWNGDPAIPSVYRGYRFLAHSRTKRAYGRPYIVGCICFAVLPDSVYLYRLFWTNSRTDFRQYDACPGTDESAWSSGIHQC